MDPQAVGAILFVVIVVGVIWAYRSGKLGGAQKAIADVTDDLSEKAQETSTAVKDKLKDL